jgi:mandelate racemase
MKAAIALDTLNLPISTHSHPFVHMHLLASMRTAAWVEYMPWWDVLFVDPPQPKDGAFELGDAPGLGLELDEKAIKQFAVQ